MIPLERSFSLTDAQSEIRRVISTLGLTYEISTAGRLVFATMCSLYDACGQLVASGLGKGDKQSSIIGSLFEAVEHYITDFCFLNHPDIRYVSSSTFSEEGQGVLTSLLTSVIYESHIGHLPCIPHRSLCSNENDFLCPIGLFIPSYVDRIFEDRYINPNDTYNYTRLGEYTSNTGVAIGMTRAEALVHGLLEASERDALSRFIFDAFLRCEDETLKKLDMDSLPRHIRVLADNVAEECSARDISIYALPNRFGIPTYCSWIDKPIVGIYQAGFGCSLSEGHAIERSLNEVAQGYLSLTKLHRAAAVEEHQRKKLGYLQSYPAFLKCAEFNISRLEELYGYKTIKYQRIEADSRRKLKHYLQSILSKIQSGDASAYAVEFVFPVETNVKVAHSIISQSDRFMTVMGGRVPMPSTIQHGGNESGKIRSG